MGEVIKVVTPQQERTKPEAKEPSRAAAPPKMPKWETEARNRLKAALKKYLKPLAELAEQRVNENDTRLLVTDILCDGLGFHKYNDLNTEYRVKGQYADYGIALDGDLIAFVEVKRIRTRLGTKHLRQVQSYAVNEGVEWIVLTDGAKWQVYHLSGGLPIVVDLAMEVDLLGDDSIGHKASEMFYLTREAISKGRLAALWQEKRATSPESFARVLLSDRVTDAVRIELKRMTGHNVDKAEISRLLRETCLREECFEK